MFKNKTKKKKNKNNSKSKFKSPILKNQLTDTSDLNVSANDVFLTPTNKYIKLESSLIVDNQTTLISREQVFSSASSTSSPNNNRSLSKSSLKTSKSTTSTSSSLINNFKHVKFLLDATTTTPSTRSTSNDDTNRRSLNQHLLLPSPATTSDTSSSNGSCCNYTETPIQFSRASSLQSLNSCSIKSPILSSYASRQESGLQSPLLNDQLSFLTNDSNPKSNEITVIERTMLLPTSEKVVNEKNENTTLYEIENSPWQCHSPNSDISSLSVIREDNKLQTPINVDLDAIYKLLNSKRQQQQQQPPQQQQLLFTPPVKLTNHQPTHEYKQIKEDPLSPTCSELSVPSMMKEDMKTSNLDFVDISFLNKRLLMYKKNDSSDDAQERTVLPEPLPTPVLNLSSENLSKSNDESDKIKSPKQDNVSSDSDDDDDDNKILLDFVNKMLPNLNKKEKIKSSSDEKENSDSNCKTKLPTKRVNTTTTTASSVSASHAPIVNMTKTAQLRASKIQKLKLEMDKNDTKFKTPIAPISSTSKFKTKSLTKKF